MALALESECKLGPCKDATLLTELFNCIGKITMGVSKGRKNSTNPAEGTKVRPGYVFSGNNIPNIMDGLIDLYD